MNHAELKILAANNDSKVLESAMNELSKYPTMRNLWSKEDVKYLRANYEKMGAKELAEHFGRTEKAVYRKVGKLELTKRDNPKPVKTQPVKEKFQRPPAIYHNSNSYEAILNKYAPL